MSITTSAKSPDLEAQIQYLKAYPEVVEKHFKAVMKLDTKELKSRIVSNIPVKTGRAAKTFGSRVTGKGIDLTGQVGWYDKDDPWYPNVLEYGAKVHAMNTYVPGLGKYIKVHPGLSARGFMAAGYSQMEGKIHADMARAAEAVVNEMAVK